MFYFRFTFTALLFSLSSSCASIAALSSGRIGCAERDIVITEKRDQIGSRTWVATCKGRRYRCTEVVVRGDKDVSCQAEGQPSASPDAAIANNPGCAFDTQCKGERLCKRGMCVDPNETAPSAPTEVAAAPPTDPENHDGLVTSHGSPLSEAQAARLATWAGLPVLVKTLSGESFAGVLSEEQKSGVKLNFPKARLGLRTMQEIPWADMKSIELK